MRREPIEFGWRTSQRNRAASVCDAADAASRRASHTRRLNDRDGMTSARRHCATRARRNATSPPSAVDCTTRSRSLTRSTVASDSSQTSTAHTRVCSASRSANCQPAASSGILLVAESPLRFKTNHEETRIMAYTLPPLPYPNNAWNRTSTPRRWRSITTSITTLT